ncbi:AMP-binding protein [uncultured Albimonas sp.]|uniref:AMP-binding protein n=1 Tax=uncultured Albimonas sp. TaxID=1331701 RepID=UPI0030EEAB8F
MTAPRPWVRIADETRAHAEIDAQARRAASGFRAMGVAEGDVVAVLMRNSFEFIEATLAAGLVGAYVVPVNWHNTTEEVRYVLDNCGALVVVAHADLLRRAQGAIPPGARVLAAPTPPAIREDYSVDEATAAVPEGVERWEAFVAANAEMQPPFAVSPGSMIYTSGTTGNPKGVRRAPPTPEQTEASGEMLRIVGGLEGWQDRMSEAVFLIPGPAYHSSPNGWLFGVYGMGGNLVVEPRFRAERVLRRIAESRITHALMVPTMFVRLLALDAQTKAAHDVSSLVSVNHVGAPCPPHVKRAMIDWFGPVITEHYGSTELGAVAFCTAEEWLAHPGTVGRALPGCEIEIHDADGNPLPPGESGEIVSRRVVYADFTYHGDDAKRRATGRAGGLLAPGDMGYLDAEGFLYLSGRASDMIIFGGTNVYPAEIEAEIHKIPGVADCAVFGIPDEAYGEVVCAHVQPDPGARLTEAGLTEALKGALASYKIPRKVVFEDSLPREDTGKIFKRKIRAPYWEALDRAI